MDYGLILPTMPAGASAEGIEAGAETAARLGWSTIWATDHVAAQRASTDEYGLIYEAITTLAWVGAKEPDLRLGTSVIVIPQRNAVLVGKELATLDALSRGRVLAGIGIGWDEVEYGNLGMGERFHVRGAYLAETIRLWRHLWSGSTDPFEGRFHRLEDFTFGPLPAQGAGLPILVGARSEPALVRVGKLADGYHSSAASPDQIAERVPVIRRGAEEAGRSMPALSARVRVDLEGASAPDGYRIAGSPEGMAVEVRRFEAAGVSHLAFAFGETDPERVASAMVRFDREVLATLR